MPCLSLKSNFFFFTKPHQIREKEGYWAIKSPDFPEYHWGNYIFFNKGPDNFDNARLSRVFSKEFSDIEGISHQAFAWPSTSKDCPPKINAQDFHLDELAVLTLSGLTKQTRPPHPSLSIKTAETDEDWKGIIAQQLAWNIEDESDFSNFEAFNSKKFEIYRQLCLEKKGIWLCAYSQQTLVASLGAYILNGICRFQNIYTAPNYRKMGACHALIRQAFQYFLERDVSTLFVIHAKRGSIAESIYRAIGFEEAERYYTLCKY